MVSNAPDHSTRWGRYRAIAASRARTRLGRSPSRYRPGLCPTGGFREPPPRPRAGATAPAGQSTGGKGASPGLLGRCTRACGAPGPRGLGATGPPVATIPPGMLCSGPSLQGGGRLPRVAPRSGSGRPVTRGGCGQTRGLVIAVSVGLPFAQPPQTGPHEPAPVPDRPDPRGRKRWPPPPPLHVGPSGRLDHAAKPRLTGFRQSAAPGPDSFAGWGFHGWRSWHRVFRSGAFTALPAAPVWLRPRGGTLFRVSPPCSLC